MTPKWAVDKGWTWSLYFPAAPKKRTNTATMHGLLKDLGQGDSQQHGRLNQIREGKLVEEAVTVAEMID